MPTREACHYDASGVYVLPHGLPLGSLASVAPQLNALREAVWAQAQHLVQAAPQGPAAAFQPLPGDEPGPDETPQNAALWTEPATPLALLTWLLMRPTDVLRAYEIHRRQSELERVLQTARRLCEEVDRLVVLGSGVAQAALAAVFRSCCHPYHNELSLGERAGGPRLYFDGHHFDAEFRHGLIDLLTERPSALKEQRWGIFVSSAAGDDQAIQVAFDQYLPLLRMACRTPEQLERRLVAAVRPGDWLHGVIQEQRLGQPILLPPYSWLDSFGPATLLPLAAAGVDVVRFLRGAAAITERFRSTAIGLNPILDLAGLGHLLTMQKGLSRRFVAHTSLALSRLSGWWEAFELAAARVQGPAPWQGCRLGFVTTEAAAAFLTSGQPMQVLQLMVESNRRGPAPPAHGQDQDPLSRHVSRLEARLAADAKAAGIPAVRLRMPRASESPLGQVMQMLPAVRLCEWLLQAD